MLFLLYALAENVFLRCETDTAHALKEIIFFYTNRKFKISEKLNALNVVSVDRRGRMNLQIG
ncbi:hypothetical protein [Dyadobacter sp. CY356]|uniref:hypothetical protein n=1 Tax=Dyadobacter sp. CY356 TaxID=2906442 RepID=UPI001F27BA52|nr:hypothetical protein [Dyadobacter sp. CY356]MCF0055214.1 hypothetical protein [Dyadobacter sp. CY356]